MTPAKPPFFIWPACWILVVLLMGGLYALCSGFADAASPAFRAGLVVGSGIVWVFASLVVAFFAWLIANGNRVATNVLFLLTLVGMATMTAGAIGVAYIARGPMAMIQKLEADSEQFQKSYDAVAEAEVLDNIEDREAVHRNLKLVETYLAQAEKMHKVISEAAENFVSQVPIPGGMREEMKRGFSQEFDKRPLKEFYAVQIALGKNLRATLELVDKHWGQWKISNDGSFEVEDKALLAEYTRLEEDRNVLIEKDEKLRERME